ncbi:reverse transcriptase [Gossypium australe]|uniref:Reverse transcriptase n=1 Tax=Gossypium australe TaxID=47621 RepID=A0A5B6WQK3_9ROSI|nr:reverse transcriptase [Gossypium australe]
MVSGKLVKFEKYLIYFSGNVGDSMQGHITNILDVRVISNLELYLGLPTMKFKINCVQGVITRVLTYYHDGKDNFIKSVLQVIPTYTMGCFLLPNSLCKEMETIIGKYLWQKGHAKYYTNTTFMEARLGYYPSLPWRSILNTRRLLKSGTK